MEQTYDHNSRGERSLWSPFISCLVQKQDTSRQIREPTADGSHWFPCFWLQTGANMATRDAHQLPSWAWEESPTVESWFYYVYRTVFGGKTDENTRTERLNPQTFETGLLPERFSNPVKSHPEVKQWERESWWFLSEVQRETQMTIREGRCSLGDLMPAQCLWYRRSRPYLPDNLSIGRLTLTHLPHPNTHTRLQD